MIITIFGFIVGLFNIFIGISDKNNAAFLIIGAICIILNVGLFMLQNWARIATFVLFIFLVLLNILLIYGTWLEISGYRQTWAFIGIIINLPLLLWSILAISTVARPKIKELFKPMDYKRGGPI